MSISLDQSVYESSSNFDCYLKIDKQICCRSIYILFSIKWELVWTLLLRCKIYNIASQEYGRVGICQRRLGAAWRRSNWKRWVFDLALITLLSASEDWLWSSHAGSTLLSGKKGWDEMRLWCWLWWTLDWLSLMKCYDTLSAAVSTSHWVDHSQ